jgi:site-specific recombinase XerD
MKFRVLERFINANEIKWSDATTTAYKADIRLFLETMQDIKQIDDETLLLQAISNDDIEDWIDSTKVKYTLDTVNRKITALKLFFRYVTINKNITKYNVMDGIEIIKINEKKTNPYKAKKLVDTLTKEEF